MSPLLRLLLIAGGSASTLYGFALLASQFVLWFRSGVWLGVPIVDLFQGAPANLPLVGPHPHNLLPSQFVGKWPWLFDGTGGWHELVHGFMDFTPLAFVFACVGLLLMRFAMSDQPHHAPRRGFA